MLKTKVTKTRIKRKSSPRQTVSSLRSMLASLEQSFNDSENDNLRLRKELANEKQARENSEKHNTILAEIAKDYDRAAADLRETGALIQTEYAVEIVNNRHAGQTLAQTLWMYLRLERKYQQEIAAMERKPWLRKVLGWLG